MLLEVLERQRVGARLRGARPPPPARRTARRGCPPRWRRTRRGGTSPPPPPPRGRSSRRPELIDAEPRPWTVMVPSASTEARSPGDRPPHARRRRPGRWRPSWPRPCSSRAGSGRCGPAGRSGRPRDRGRRSSSSTVVSSLMTNRGPLAPTSTAPWAPLSLEPNRSMMIDAGKLLLELVLHRGRQHGPARSDDDQGRRVVGPGLGRRPAPRPGDGPWRRRPGPPTPRPRRR